MRGASFLVAVTFAAEIGDDVRRFDTPKQLASFLGLVPAESSTGDTIRWMGLTLAGNRRARRALVEAAWTYRYPARVSETLRARLEGLPKPVRDIAWKAQARLCARYRRLGAMGKSRPSSWPRSPAKWPLSCGPSHGKSRFKVYIACQKRRVTDAIKRELRRRAAVQPVIGHAKVDRRMGGNFLNGAQGDVARRRKRSTARQAATCVSMVLILALTKILPLHNSFDIHTKSTARYYVLSVEPTLFAESSLLRRWGRIGCAGRTRIDLHASPPLAQMALNTWLERERRRGYRLRT